MANQIKIADYGKHCVFLGSTGSGKSVLAEEMLKHIKSYFIFDTQDVFNFKGAKVVKTPIEAIKSLKDKRLKIIYKPSRQYHNREINGLILTAIMDSSTKKNPNKRVVYIDEIFHLGYERSFPQELPIALAICRQKKISFWISTQRPKLIPTNILSESSYIYCFFLSKGDDIKYLADNIRGDKKEFIEMALNMVKDDYKFIVLDQNNGSYELMNKIKK